MDKNMTLLVMAAGMGSRFGGLKQIEPVGPHGEVILEFSVYDALEAGFVVVGAGVFGAASSIASSASGSKR